MTICGGFVWHYYKGSPRYQLEKLYIYLEDDDFSKLSNLRNEAKEAGYLKRSPDDFVSANIIYRSQNINGKVRLKGDWTDHLKRNKWSFRIKLNKEMDDGLKTFSVQNPPTRGYLNGYIYHKLLKQEGVLSNEFRFIEVFVNDKSWGTYTLEEHLTSRMITNQNKPEGILLKFDDQVFFNADIKKESTIGLIKSAEIKTYGKPKKQDKYKTQVNAAIDIIKGYQFQTDSVYNMFNTKTMASYYAISDLAVAYHALGWINIRFYYNFNTGLMEPVGYDGYPIMDWAKPYLGHKVKTDNPPAFSTEMIIYQALKNEVIQLEYKKALERITDSVYIEKFMSEEKELIDFYETELQKDYHDYSFDQNWLYNNARRIRNSLNF